MVGFVVGVLLLIVFTLDVMMLGLLMFPLLRLFSILFLPVLGVLVSHFPFLLRLVGVVLGMFCLGSSRVLGFRVVFILGVGLGLVLF